MRLTLNGKLIGLALGLVAGLLFVFLGWKAFLILLGFSLLGFAMGAWIDSHESVKRRLKKLTDRVLRS
jgi:ribose/xylose/arabinose/galactoside ABC-type transport system permease subunit